MNRRGEFVALVLAAGRARRFGDQKLLAPFRGAPLVRGTVENALASSADRVVVVTGEQSDSVARALGGLPLTILRNPEPARGMSSSIHVGIRAVPDASAVLVLLGDQPLVGPEHMDRILGADPRGEVDIVVPLYREGPANPVLFRSAVFPELLELSGDEGARSVVERDPERVLRVPFDRSIPVDVDTPEDLERLREESME